MLRVGTILIWLALVPPAPAQSREDRQAQRLGPLEITFRPDELVVRRGAREWRILMSRLPVRAADCDIPTEREHCEALPGQSPCVECMYDPSPLAWDEARESLYLAVATGISKNRPWIIFRYRLGDGQITRVTVDYGAGFDWGTLSPSGQYLAYVAYASNGICGTDSSIKVIDLRSQQSASTRYGTRSDDEIVSIQSLRWATAAALEYSAEIHSGSDCRQAGPGNYSKRTVTDRVEIVKLGLR